MKGLMYVRVSTKEQVDKTSLDMQVAECRKAADKDEVVISEDCVFREEGESAKVTDRPELQRLLEYVRTHKKEIDVLYIWKIDRLSRSLGDYYGIKVALNQYGVRIVSVTEPIDDDPVGRFLEAILAAAAQFDNDIRAIRTTGGMRSRIEQGRWPHDAAIGYLKKDGRVVKDKHFGPIVKDILEKFSQGGWNYTDIAKYAFDKGIMTKSGKRRTTDAMKAMLRNYIYAGYVTTKLTDKVVKGLHEPLVPLEVIQKNRDIIDGTVNNYSLHGDDMFPLRGGFLLCRNCLNPMTASAPRGRSGGRYPQYHCNKATCKKKVTGISPSVSVDKAHEDFRQLLKSLKPLNDGVARLFKQIVVRRWNDQFEQAISGSKKLQVQIDRCDDYELKINKKYIEGKITEAERDLQKRANEKELRALQRELAELEDYKENYKKIVDNAMQFITNPEIFWNQSETPVKRMVQQFIAPNGIPYSAGTGFGTTKDIESYLLINKIGGKSAEKVDLVAPTRIELVTSGL